VFVLECTISGHQICEASILVYWTQNDFGIVAKHFPNLRHVKRWKTCVLGMNALFWGTKLAKDPFYSIGTKMMVVSVSKHFANLRHVKRCKTCVRTTMHYFRVPKLWSIRSSLLDQKWCLGVFQAFFKLSTRKKMKNLCFGPECTISGYQTCEGSVILHWNQNDGWECFRAFR
jgi:hypothetical protein